MKKITLFLVFAFIGAFSFVSFAQTLNQPASWPNAAWSLTGTYTPAGLLSDPSVAGTTFTWDDDAAGNGSADDLQMTSPVIDLTAASGAGETWLTVSGSFVYRALGGDILAIEVYNADTTTWTAVQTFVGNSTTLDYQTCAGTVAYTSAIINIGGYTPTQLSGFQYRFSYNDLGGWQWGWCLTSPTITSAAPPTCATPSTGVVTNMTGTSANLGWTELGSATAWDIEWGAGGFTPTGTPTINDTTNNPYTLSGLTPGNQYTFYVRADCGMDNSNTSGWLGPINFTFNPAPANDDCSGAIGLTVNADLSCGVVTAGTTSGSTASSQPDDVSGTPNNDVWFSFTATATSHNISLLNLVSQPGSPSNSIDMGIGVYDGTAGCASLVFSSTSDPESYVATGLSIGTLYYVRVYGWYNTIANTNFNICVGTLPPAPANDDCANALPLTESATSACANQVSGTTVSATPTATGTCSAVGKDVWYAFTPLTTGNYNFLVTETLDYGTSSTYVAVYSGACGGLTQVGTGCTSTSISDLALTSGTPYYVVVRSTSTTAGVNFNLCAFPSPPAPANDTCGGALPLNESTDFTCNNQVSGTTVSATPTATGTCSAVGKDVWYAFTPLTTGNYNFKVTETQDFGASSTYVSVYSGACGATTQVGTGCTSLEILNLPLTSGTPYYVVVRSTSTTAGVNFNLCAYPAPAPANDDCSGAIALTPGVAFTTNPLIGNNAGATASQVADPTIPAPTCGSYSGGDVWYSVVVPNNGNITIETNANPTGSGGDSGMTVYSGTCGALVTVECDDDDSPDGNYSLVTISNPALANQTVYVRVWEYGNNAFLNFQVSAWSSSLGTEEVTINNSFTYFPNPVKNTLALRAQKEIQNVSIYNMLGQEVVRTSPNTLESDVDMSSLQTGAYFVKVSIDNTVKTIRIIKQ